MDARYVVEQQRQQPAAAGGTRVVGAAAFHCRAARSVLRDSRVPSAVPPGPVLTTHGPGPVLTTHGPAVFYRCRMDGGGGGAQEQEEAKNERTSSRGSGRSSHDVEKPGLGDHRDAGSSGVLKRASPTHCPAVNGQPPGGFMHLDIRNPGKQAELRQPLPSSHIPVPRNRKPSGHADKEVMAATVLTSLSTSPLVLNPPSTATVPDPASRAWKEVLSASYSSSTSGNWSWDASDQSVPSTPSPPLSTDANKNFLLSPQGDDVTEDVAENPHFMFEDPIPRKRKNSMKVMFKCLWKNCEQVLSTSSGIQRHVRTAHLGRGSDSDYSDGEEDFYYTEIEVNMDSLTEGLSSLTPTSPTTCGPPPVFPPPRAAFNGGAAGGAARGAVGGGAAVRGAAARGAVGGAAARGSTRGAAACGGAAAAVPHSENIAVSGGAQGTSSPTLLSQSAPSTLYHIHTDHAYQGPVTQVHTVSAGASASATPPPKANGNRKPRGDAKKCRKVYGMEKREMWCTACRWKKACQRFTD